jgi:hypothetical protein
MFIIRHDPRSAASRLAVFGNVVLSAFPYTACSVLVTRSAALGVDPVQHFPIHCLLFQRGLSYGAVGRFEGISANNDARPAMKY